MALDYSFGPDATYANYSQTDLNNGLTCMADSRPGSGGWTKCISSESYDGRVRTWGELSSEMDWAATINAAYPDSARRAVWYNNPSWHLVGQVWDPAQGPWNFAAGYAPSSIGPTAPGDTKVYIIDPESGTKIDTTNVSDPNAPVTSDGRSINQIVYGTPTPPASQPADRPSDDDFFTQIAIAAPTPTALPMVVAAPAPAPVSSPAASSSSSSTPAASSSSSPPWWVFAGVGLALIVALRGKS